MASFGDAVPHPVRQHHQQTGKPWYSPLLRHGVLPFLLAGDLVACLGAAWLAQSPVYDAVLFPLALIAGLSINGLYRSKLSMSVLDDIPDIFRAWLFAVAVVLMYHQFVLQWLGGIRMMLIGFALIITIRSLTYFGVRLLRRTRVISHPTVVLGDDPVAEEIARRLVETPTYGLEPIGFLEDHAPLSTTRRLPHLGTESQLVEVLENHNPRVLIVSHAAVGDDELVGLLRDCHRHSCEMFVVPRLSEVQHKSVDSELIWDIPIIRLRRAAYRAGTWRLKRILDVTVAAISLVVLSPLLLACAAAVRLADGPGGVIFRQERVGVDGRRFELMKFRSLKPVDENESQTQCNISHDDRLGPVGRFLRKSSLDELPQLINILRGDMSLVGPRPERPHFVNEFSRLYTGYTHRHRVPCGLTGWAQIHGLRGDTPIADRARFDNWYIENWSLWLDLKILLRTFSSVFRAPGA